MRDVFFYLHSISFDKRYLIKSSKPDLVKKLMTTEFQKALLENNIYSVSYKTNAESQKAELITVIQRKAGNKDFIIGLINIYMFLIDRLAEMKMVL